MKEILLIIGLIIGIPISLIMFPAVRIVVTHPGKIFFYLFTDIYDYFKKRKFNIAKTGHIKCYCGLFGKGKTLSAVKEIVDLYNRYNNIKIYDFTRKKFVTQKVHVLSNVQLNIPFEYFKSLEQVVYISQKYKDYDEKNNIRTVHYCLIDEASVQLNSRSWKKNIDPLFLNTLLTCRHHFIEIILTSQRFNHLDSLLRQVCDCVIQVNKKWRFQILSYYDAYELENSNTPNTVKPFMKSCFIVEQKHFDNYDTMACVENLKKDFENGSMITEEEILKLQNNKELISNDLETKHKKLIF